MTEEDFGRHHGRLRIPRSRGAVSGILLIILGVWGAVIPLIGPYFDFAYTPDDAFTFTAGRFWLENLPGIVAVLGGLLLVTTANRAVAVLGGYLAVAAGAWFVVGTTVASYFSGGWTQIGTPVGSKLTQMLETLTFFNGLGVLIVFLAAQGLGRVTVRSLRDVAAVEKHHDSQVTDDSDRDHDGAHDMIVRRHNRDRDVVVDRDRDRDLSDRDLTHRDSVVTNRDVVDREGTGRDHDVTARDPHDGESAGRHDPSDQVDLTERDGGSSRVARE